MPETHCIIDPYLTLRPFLYICLSIPESFDPYSAIFTSASSVILQGIE